MASGVARRQPRTALRALLAVAAAALTAQWTVVAAAADAPAPAPESGSAESAQEVTMEALGLPAQTLFGGSNTVGTFFPAPAAQLAGSGSLVRLFFAHSSLLDPAASSAAVRVNGQDLATLPLDGATADGAVADVQVPTAALHGDRPNLVELRFEVRLAGRPAAQTEDPSAFVRLENHTLLRYQLYGPPGSEPPARLDAFPFPLVGTHGIAPARLGVVMPAPPTDGDLATGLRLVADVARRDAGQQVAPTAVTEGQLDWLRAGGTAALVVGPEARLPAAEPLLRAAGFAMGIRGWVAPDGREVGADDGIVAAVTSPWDRRSPIVLVTGAGDGAVVRAAAALLAPGRLDPDAPFAVVRAGVPPASTAPADLAPVAGTTMTLPALATEAVEVQGGGRRAVNLTFPAPAVDPGGTGDLALTVSHRPLPAGQRSSLAALLNGVGVGTVALDRGNERDTGTHLRVPGGLLRPGRNTLTLDLSLAGDAAASARIARGARLRLPPAPPAAPGLELLPHPILDDPAGVHVVLAEATDPVLSAAARVVAALGSRSTGTPGLSATLAAGTRPDALSGRGVLVVGVSAGSRDALRLARALGLPDTPLGRQARPSPPLGVIELLTPPRSPGHHALWVDGTSPAALALAGDALFRGGLAGSAASVDGSGRARTIAADLDDRGEPFAVTSVKVLIAAAACLLVLGVAWQAWRPHREES